jgi:hypothetical protein
VKRIALFTFALLMAAGLYAQTVKPALPVVGPYPEGSNYTYATSIFITPKCGWQGKERVDGKCEITMTAPPDYENFSCTVVSHKQNEPYVVTCTWIPAKEKAKP